MAEAHLPPGPEGCSPLSRREFVKALGTAAIAASVPLGARPHAPTATAASGPGPSPPDESAVGLFYKSLGEEQRRRICFPPDHPKRSQVDNNWAIVKPTIRDLSGEQQALCREIFKDLCSEEGYERFQRQMDEDYGGFGSYHVAVFGAPGTDGPFEWVLTGRHATLRADGNRPGRVASGGPIFYGHAADGPRDGDPGRTSNVWWYPGRQANAIFATLDEAGRRRALVHTRAPDDRGVPGLPVSTLDDAQKRMVQQLLRDLIRPFRAFDVDEIQECLRAPGGADTLRLTYFQDGDIGDAPIPAIWKLEGPAFAWYFHGSPHVHTWVHIDRRAPRC